ncbi:MAG TPA: lysylphosphatidylglycerol synthase transmembrane domain-containing protein [Rhodanobacteraceae bacterium]|jgi:uncharacterized protein (TIRG00374 family)|nr:lysylphosphatidylglycerol synthase transmembrane domain-containing protein [Rhodanobacteraceae bacterium]
MAGEALRIRRSARFKVRKNPSAAPVERVLTVKETVSAFAHPALKAIGQHRVLLTAGLVATIVIPFLLGGARTLSTASEIAAEGYAALLLLVTTSWLARALKLHLLLRRLKTPTPFARSLGISLASDLAFAVTPAGVGGYVASVYYLKQAGASTSGAATITTMDQFSDLVFFAISVPLAALALAGSGQPQAVTTASLIAAALTSALLVAIWLARARISSFLTTPTALPDRPSRLQQGWHALRTFLASMSAQISPVVSSEPIFLFWILGLTALQWLTRYGVFWLTLLLLGHAVSFALTFLLQVAVLHAAVWTGIPAGGGGAELGLTATLAPWIAPADTATALIIWRAATLYTSVLVGSIAIVVLAKKNGGDGVPDPDASDRT